MGSLLPDYSRESPGFAGGLKNFEFYGSLKSFKIYTVLDAVTWARRFLRYR
jgi:hypothetical protein